VSSRRLAHQDNPTQQANLGQVNTTSTPSSPSLRKPSTCDATKGVQAALAVVTTDRGKVEMDAIRSQLDVMRQEEGRLRQIRMAEMEAAYKTALASGVLTGLLGAALTIACSS
jgi:CHASE3 domain sensor protein